MKNLIELTCPDCGRTLRYVGCVEKTDKTKVYEYECCCGFSKEKVVQGDKK